MVPCEDVGYADADERPGLAAGHDDYRQGAAPALARTRTAGSLRNEAGEEPPPERAGALLLFPGGATWTRTRLTTGAGCASLSSLTSSRRRRACPTGCPGA